MEEEENKEEEEDYSVDDLDMIFLRRLHLSAPHHDLSPPFSSSSSSSLHLHFPFYIPMILEPILQLEILLSKYLRNRILQFSNRSIVIIVVLKRSSLSFSQQRVF